MQVCQEVNSLESTRRDLVGKAVVLPIGAEENEDFAAALERLKNGKGAFALPFGKRDARKLVEEVIVLGSAPAKVEQWELVSDALEWRVAAKKCVARWNSVVAEFGLTPQNGDIDDSFKRIVLLRGQIVDLHKLAFEFDAKLPSAIERVFGQRVVAQFKEQGDPLLQTIQFCLQVHLDRRNLASALLRHEGIKQKLIGREGPIVDNIQEFLIAKLGNRDIDEIELQRRWHALQAELLRLCSLRPALDQIAHVSAEIEASGARRWAVRVRTQAAEADHDPVIPAEWREAWEWRCASTFLDTIDVHHQLRNLFVERQSLTDWELSPWDPTAWTTLSGSIRRKSIPMQSMQRRPTSMNKRPFLNKRIDELEQVFRDAGSDGKVFGTLEGELVNRKTPRAVSLLRKVRRVLANPGLAGGGSEPTLFDPRSHEASPPAPTSVSREQESRPNIGFTLRPPELPTSTVSSTRSASVPPNQPARRSEPIQFPSVIEQVRMSAPSQIVSLEDACKILHVTLGSDWETIEKARSQIVQSTRSKYDQRHPPSVARWQ